MDNATLLALITGDSQANAMATAFNDSGCAARCSVIAPNVAKTPPVMLGQLGLIKVFAAVGQVTGGDDFLKSLETIASGSESFAGTVHRMLQSIYPPGEGVDFSDPVLNAELTAWSQLTPPLVSASALAVIQAACTQPQTITADQVSAAMLGHR